MVAGDPEDRLGVVAVRGEELGAVVGFLPVRVHHIAQVVEEVHAVRAGQLVGHGGGHVALRMAVPPAAGVAQAMEPQRLIALDLGERLGIEDVGQEARGTAPGPAAPAEA